MNPAQEYHRLSRLVSDLKKEPTVQDTKRTSERQSGFNKMLHLTRKNIGIDSLRFFHATGPVHRAGELIVGRWRDKE
jgi:hypothetical protein